MLYITNKKTVEIIAMSVILNLFLIKEKFYMVLKGARFKSVYQVFKGVCVSENMKDLIMLEW